MDKELFLQNDHKHPGNTTLQHPTILQPHFHSALHRRQIAQDPTMTVPIFGPYHTPRSPADALSLGPLRGCSMGQIRPAPKRAIPAYLDDLQWTGGGRMPQFIRSASSNAVVLPKRPENNAGRHHDRSASWQSLRSIDDHVATHMHGQTYTPKQVESQNYYRNKGRLSWSLEYGRHPNVLSGTVSPASPVSPPSSPLSPPPRIVELEGSPLIAQASRFQRHASITSSPQGPKPAVAVGRALQVSPLTHGSGDAMIIKRKPVGSGISPKRRPADLNFIGRYESPDEMGGGQARAFKNQPYARRDDSSSGKKHEQHLRSETGRPLSAAWETSAEAFHPEDLLSCSPGALRAKGSPERSTNRTQRPKPPVRFASRSDSNSSGSSLEERASDDSRGGDRMANASARKRNARSTQPLPLARQGMGLDIALGSNPSLDLSAIVDWVGSTANLSWDFVHQHVISNYYDRQQVKEYLLYTLKFVLLLYIAASLWNILSGIKDGLVRALQPLITLWTFVRWLLTAGS